MKKVTSVCSPPLHTNLIKKISLTSVLMLVIVVGSFATNYTSVANTNWNVASTWSPSGIPVAGDNVTIAAGTTVTVTAAAACTNLTINGNLTMNNSGFTLQIGNSGSNTGSLTLGSGSNFFIGSANTVEFVATQTGPGITNNGGTIASTGVNGADGGTIQVDANSGGGFFVGGTSATVVNNFKFIQNASFNISGPSLLINGTFTIPNNNWNWAGGSKAPIYGPGSTLYINRGNQGYSQGLEWSANSGTIGVTPGYPNNVTLVNMGSSSGGTGGTGWVPTGAVGLNGTLQVGDGTTNGRISLESVSSFTSGGIIVNNNSLIDGPPTAATFIDKGNFTLTGATTGIFQSMGATINFAGSGTSGAPQTISTTGGSVSFTNMTVSNSTYVKLLSPVGITNTLNLTSGYVGTTATNLLSVNNSATTAIVGGSSSAYIDGPLAWSIPATSTNSYVFPIGDLSHNGGAYLPLTLSPNTSSGAIVTATAFNQNSNGSHDATITSISPTDYWSVSTSSPFTSSPLVNVTQPSAVTPYNALAVSSTSNGRYTAIGGIPNTGTPGTISGGGIGTGSTAFITMVTAPLSVVKLSGTNVTCNGTVGSLTVGGSGGTAPYQYSIDGGAFQASGIFTPLSSGYHSVRVKDNTGTIVTDSLKVTGSLVINGNDHDTYVCAGSTATLTASNQLNSNPTYSWSTSRTGSPVIGNSAVYSTTVTGTYYVTSNIYDTTTNLLTNGSFESGNTGFSSSYANYTGAQYGTTPGNNGYYSISNAGTNQCQWFSIGGTANGATLSAEKGSSYFIADGAVSSSMVWQETISGLILDTTYTFIYYYAGADPTAPYAILNTAVTNGTITGSLNTGNGIFYNAVNINDTAKIDSKWTKAVYTIKALSTSMTITLSNTISPGGTVGNDFYLDNMQLLAPCKVTDSVRVVQNCVALPVELINFNAVKQGAGALVTWETANEQNSAYFIVEKSSDGISFEPTGKVNAAGNSVTIHSYTFTDPSITSGTTYYRLAQYDINGEVHYNVIKTVSKEGISTVQVVPNPNNGTFAVIFDNAGDVKSQISVFNALGQVVYEDLESTTNYENIDISQLASGIYYLHVNTQAQNVVKKIIKE